MVTHECNGTRNLPVLEVPLGVTYEIDIAKGMRCLSRIAWRVGALEIGFPELVRDIGKIFHHAALALPQFTPLLLFFRPALERFSRTIKGINAAHRRLSRSARCSSAVGMDVLRIHLRGNGKAGERDGETN